MGVVALSMATVHINEMELSINAICVRGALLLAGVLTVGWVKGNYPCI